MKRKNRTYVSMLMAMLMFALYACGGASQGGTGDSDASGEGGVLRIAVSADIATMDVHLTSNDYLVPMNVFDALLHGQLAPGFQ